MSKETYDLTRRKILGSLGVMGAGAALGGAGTTAFFSDEEQFKNNKLVAGELDMKVDWEEHYSDWSEDEGKNVTVSMTDDSLGYGFPSAAANKLLYVDDKDQFLANTAIESFPDTLENDPGENDYDGKQATLSPDDKICDIDADLDGVLSHKYRTGANVSGGVTIGEGPNAQTTKAGDPLINISDVKPGDFGEVTFSFHLCGNPGWVWLTGDLVEAKENGLTEPERKDDQEVSGKVELLDAIKAAFWYDTGSDGTYGEMDNGEGDNYHQSGEAFIPLVGSLRNVLEILEGGMIPLDFTPIDGDGNVTVDSNNTSFDICTDASDAIEVLTNSDLGVESARNLSCEQLDDLLVEKWEAEEGTEYVGTKIEAGGLQVGTYTAGNGGIIEVEQVDIANGTVTLSTNFPVEVVKNKGGNEGANYYVFEDKGGTDPSDPEEFGCILDSVQFSTPTGQAISNIELCFDSNIPSDGGDGDGGDGGDGGRECFPNSTTGYVGFEWWLPVDHANEIQTDSVSFDLGFYTEQCRHNDGSGMPPETIEGNVGSGDFSDISYNKAFSMQALSKAGSGRGEIQIHGDSGGVENTTLWGSDPGDTFPADTDVPFVASVDPNAETASLTINGVTVTDDDVTDGDANGESTSEPEWQSGIPSVVDIALTTSSGDSNVTTVVKDVTVNGIPVDPGSISAQDGLTFLEIEDVSTDETVTVEGVLRFEGSTSDFDGQDFVGIDWR